VELVRLKAQAFGRMVSQAAKRSAAGALVPAALKPPNYSKVPVKVATSSGLHLRKFLEAHW